MRKHIDTINNEIFGIKGNITANHIISLHEKGRIFNSNCDFFVAGVVSYYSSNFSRRSDIA